MEKVIITILFIAIASSSFVYSSVINIPDDYITIQEGINAAFFGDTVLVQPATYVENINFNGKRILLGSLFLTTGDTTYISTTIIDGNSLGSVVTFNNQEDSASVIIGFTIQNGLFEMGAGLNCTDNSSPVIKYNIIAYNNAEGNYGRGGGIYCSYSNPVIAYNFIAENNAVAYMVTSGGGGISCYYSNPRIENNVIVFNSAIIGAGVNCSRSNPAFCNNTISLNSANWYGGGIFCYFSSPSIVNSIIWGNTAEVDPQIYADSIDISYSCIQNGWPGIGNIDVFPHFRDPINNDFHLKSIECGNILSSLCIDSGCPTFLDRVLNCYWGLGDYLPDMGAYGGGECVQTGVDDNLMSYTYLLFQNHPNPFNASTNIKFLLYEPSNVVVEIYSILGRKLETILEGEQPAGEHQLIWNAENHTSGIYFYRIQAGDYAKTKKMLLLK
jgi:hypothetical protein